MGLFSTKKPEPQPKQPNAAVYIVKQINGMARSDNYDMVYGMLCFAYDFQLIDSKERQALDSKLRERASELREEEKKQALIQKQERDRIIAEQKAKRAQK